MTSKSTKHPHRAEGSTHTSLLLQHLIDDAPKDHFTLDWVIHNLPKNSFGFILLFLSVIALLPVISVVARVLMSILLCQIILGYHKPVLPRRLVHRPISSRYLTNLKPRIIPALQFLEKIIRPRWPVMFMGSRRIVAFIALLNIALSLPLPLPLANMPPAMTSALMALAYIEHDGVILAIALFFSVAMLTIVLWAIFQTALL